ncbi:MAG: PAS domain-containing protein [Anaerolineales bacterium]
MSENTLGAKDQIELIFNVAPMGLMLLNEDQEIITANRALLTCLGYEEDELKHTCLIDYCHPLDREPLEKVLRRTGLQEAHTGSAVVRFLAKSGHYIWVELSVGNNLTGQAFQGNSVVVVHKELWKLSVRSARS